MSRKSDRTLSRVKATRFNQVWKSANKKVRDLNRVIRVLDVAPDFDRKAIVRAVLVAEIVDIRRTLRASAAVKNG